MIGGLGNVLKFISSLKDRTLRIRVEESLSAPQELQIGVPQGSPLSGIFLLSPLPGFLTV